MLKAFLTFEGRLNRWAFLWMNVVRLVVPVLFMMAITVVLAHLQSTFLGALAAVSIAILSVLVIVSGISMGVRRLHDLNFSGWWLLLMLVPLVNVLLIMVFLFVKGTTGPNDYGEDPLKPGKIMGKTEVVDEVPPQTPRLDEG